MDHHDLTSQRVPVFGATEHQTLADLRDEGPYDHLVFVSTPSNPWTNDAVLDIHG